MLLLTTLKTSQAQFLHVRGWHLSVQLIIVVLLYGEKRKTLWFRHDFKHVFYHFLKAGVIDLTDHHNLL